MIYIIQLTLIILSIGQAEAAASEPRLYPPMEEREDLERGRRGITEVRAIEWYREQAEREADDDLIKKYTAQRVLSEMIREGWGGVEVDEEEADRLLEQAAINGDSEAQFQMAAVCAPRYYDLFPLTLTKDSKDWLKRAAENGHPKALYRFGVYLYMYGGEKNKGWHMVCKSAEHNNPQALYWLGTAYEDSWIIPTSRAIDFYKRAARKGHPKAVRSLERLGVLLED